MAKIASLRGLPLLVLLLFAAGSQAHAASLFGSADPGTLCSAAVADATRAYAIPPGLLDAIGRVESGRRNAATGVVTPWPWTVDANGSGSFYATKAEAIAAVQSAEASGIHSIDVGCMQINLLHHPNAFASLAQAFDPEANARYAARFLRRLHSKTGNWPQAAASYHSTTPEFALPYKRQVMAAWTHGSHGAAGFGPSLPVVYEGARRAPPMPATTGPFAGRAGAFMLRNRPLGRAPATPLVFGPPTLGGRNLDSYRRSPILIASDALHGR